MLREAVLLNSKIQREECVWLACVKDWGRTFCLWIACINDSEWKCYFAGSKDPREKLCMFFTCLCQRQNITVAFLTCFHEEYVHWLGNCAFALLISKVQRESYVMTCSSKRFRRKCVLLMCFCHERVLLACLLSKSQLDSCGFDLLVQYQRFISGLYGKYEKKRCHFCWIVFDCCASDYWFLNSVSSLSRLLFQDKIYAELLCIFSIENGTGMWSILLMNLPSTEATVYLWDHTS